MFLRGKLQEVQYWSGITVFIEVQGKWEIETRKYAKTVRMSVLGRKGSRFTCLAEDLVKTWTVDEVI